MRRIRERKEGSLAHFIYTVAVPFVLTQIVVSVAWLGEWRQYRLAATLEVIGLALTVVWYLIDRRNVKFRADIDQDLDAYKKATRDGLITGEADAIRTLQYIEKEGTLLNVSSHHSGDKPRNVLLNNKTIQTILNEIKTHGKDGEKDLEGTGAKCGADFGHVLLGLPIRPPTEDVSSLLNQWFHYDSFAGIGKMELKSFKEAEIKIAVHYNFLTHSDEYCDPSKSLCAFMRGYIKGVFVSLPRVSLERAGYNRAKITVNHDPNTNDCVCTSLNRQQGCIFTITNSHESG